MTIAEERTRIDYSHQCMIQVKYKNVKIKRKWTEGEQVKYYSMKKNKLEKKRTDVMREILVIVRDYHNEI